MIILKDPPSETHQERVGIASSFNKRRPWCLFIEEIECAPRILGRSLSHAIVSAGDQCFSSLVLFPI